MIFVSNLTNYNFTLAYFQVLKFHVLHLNYENFKLYLQNTLNMLKTTRVYFGVLQGMAARATTFLVVSEPRFRQFYKMIFEIVYDMHCDRPPS